MKRKAKNNSGSTIIVLLLIIDVLLSVMVIQSIQKLTDSNKEIMNFVTIKPEKIVEPEQEQEEIISEIVYAATEEDLINNYIETVCDMYNMDPALIQSIVWHESRYEPTAVNGSCVGLMQISTRWHADRAIKLGVTDFYDPYSNILLGVDYLNELFTNYGDESLVLMLYNMKHDTALDLYEKGCISKYATSVISRSDEIRRGVI